MSALKGYGGTGQPDYPPPNRYRAGQPADLSLQLHRVTRCPAADSACNGPKEGECMGLCDMPVQFAGPEPDENERTLDWLVSETVVTGDDGNAGLGVYTYSPETPLRARIMDAAADGLDWVLDHLWWFAAGLVAAGAPLVWSLK